MAKQSEKILVTMEEIATYTGRNRKTIRDWIETANFPAIKDDGRWTANAELIDRWNRRRIEKLTCEEV